MPKPPILVRYEDVSECEFERHGRLPAPSRTFDLSLTTKKGMSYQFHGISRTEFQNLVNFLTAKGLPMGEVDANALADRLIDEDDMAGIDDGGPALEEVRTKTKTPRKTKILKAPRTRTVVNQPIRVPRKTTRTRRIQRMVVKKKTGKEESENKLRALQPPRKKRKIQTPPSKRRCRRT